MTEKEHLAAKHRAFVAGVRKGLRAAALEAERRGNADLAKDLRERAACGENNPPRPEWR